jgi:hypothetical protein
MMNWNTAGGRPRAAKVAITIREDLLAHLDR